MRIPTPIQFTKEGYQKVKDDLSYLNLKRPHAVTSLRLAREMGDLSENGAYKAARFELSGIDREIRRCTYLLRFGEIAERSSLNEIGFGHEVTLDDGHKKITFLLVDKYEASPKEHKLSIASPIGKAIVGKWVGDTVTVSAPKGYTNYTIISVK